MRYSSTAFFHCSSQRNGSKMLPYLAFSGEEALCAKWKMSWKNTSKYSFLTKKAAHSESSFFSCCGAAATAILY